MMNKSQDQAYMEDEKGFCFRCGNKLKDKRCDSCTNYFKTHDIIQANVKETSETSRG